MKKFRVFISYCHSTRARTIVDRIVYALKKSGIEVVYDAVLKLGQHLTPFMERIQDPTIEKVLCVVDKKYAEKADERKGGVGKESCIITQTVYEKNQTRIIPIFCNKDRKGVFYAPVFFKDVKGIDFTVESKRNDGIKKILDEIKGVAQRETPKKKSTTRKASDSRKLIITYDHSDLTLMVRNISSSILDDVHLVMNPNLLYENQGEDDDGSIEIGIMAKGDIRTYKAGWSIGDDPKITHSMVTCEYKCGSKRNKESVKVKI